MSIYKTIELKWNVVRDRNTKTKKKKKNVYVNQMLWIYDYIPTWYSFLHGAWQTIVPFPREDKEILL